MITQNDIRLTLWGKTDRSDPSLTPNYHPLLFHMLDVGNTARMLWRHCVNPTIKSRISEQFRLSDHDAEQFIALICALHDIGKAVPGFQNKSEGLMHRTGLTVPTDCTGKGYHPHASAVLIQSLAPKGACSLEAQWPVARVLSRIIGAHHGAFPRAYEVRANSWGKTVLGDEEWTQARQSLFESVSIAIRGDASPLEISLDEVNDSGVVSILAGLMSVADWIGSSVKDFPLASLSCSVSDYVPRSEKQSVDALERLGWLPRPSFGSLKTFRELFPTIKHPNAMQLRIEERIKDSKAPYLLIVESAMGSGKTEAALFAVDAALCSGLASGFYFALPTQATGNAMYERVRRDYLEPADHEGKKNLQLVHGNRLAAEKLTANSIYGDGDSDMVNDVVAEAWFTNTKQALLAPFGVGTIDQTLISVLQTKHWFVRIFGLAGKIIVFDEIHSFDVYMTKIFKRLLAWLAEIDCTVIMLSATLPNDKRTELASAYAEGRGWQMNGLATCDYPRVTHVYGDGEAAVVPVGDTDEKSKNVHISFSSSSVDAVVERTKLKLERGGCATVIFNTVDHSQEMYRAMKASITDCEFLLLHARMPQIWRQSAEAKLLSWYGKASDSRPPKSIVVGTQILECSINYDSDWMVSDFAPVDLLLQRMGRLHRHERSNRPIADPEFVVLCDFDEQGRPVFGDANEHIYRRYVLLRSFLALRENDNLSSILLPEDIDRLVQQAYCEKDDHIDPWWHENLQDSLAKFVFEQKVRSENAGKILVGDPIDLDDLLEDHNNRLEEADNPEISQKIRAQTRDGNPSLTVICTGTDIDGNPLGLHGAEPKNKGEVNALLEYSLPISQKSLFFTLCKAEIPKGWNDQAALRYCREIHFINGIAMVGVNEVRISREEGLTIVRN